ncbi:MAG: hypothetical protein H6981_06210 [Gammaproteobacteria bacterium]|nr:hypothetical protein [Gammaproteobacteria bacterium]MCP5136377.1 hypothetical protein [Gammaproteobacteria bacterium]
MTITTGRQDPDPVVMFGMLSESVLNHLQSTEQSRLRDVYLSGLLRFLDAYRYDAFSDATPSGVLDRGDLGREDTSGARYRVVADAFAVAQNTLFGSEIDRDVAMNQLEEEIAGIKKAVADGQVESRNVRQFLEIVQRELASR